MRWRGRSRARALRASPSTRRDPDVVYAGCRGGGLARSADGGRSWRALELPEPDVFSVAVSAADGAVYAGTEPSRLFRSRDQGESFEELTALQEIPSREEWSFPPRPWTGTCAGSRPTPIAPSACWAHRRRRCDLQRSPSRGPARRARARLAPDGRGTRLRGGRRRSGLEPRRGHTWGAADEGRDRHYVWALAPDVTDPDRWFVSAAPGARRAHGDGPAEAAVYRWSGEGPWEPLTDGLADPLDSMPYALGATGSQLFAGLGDGQIYRSRDRGDMWERLPARADAILALAAVDPVAETTGGAYPAGSS